jgi:hypothetical protein
MLRKAFVGIATSAAIGAAVALAPAVASAQHGGGGHGGGGHGGGGHGGGGGFHGGGGGFHGGGGGFHGGGGGFHGGGGGFHGFHGGGFRVGGGGFHGFHGFGGHGFGGRHFAGHGGHGLAGRLGHVAAHRVAGHGNVARFGASHDWTGGRGLAAHNQFGGVNRFAAGGQRAHNQFAAQHFQGLNNFNRTGFNRNAFGNGQGWNGWGGNFWGAGWNNWGSGWGGWAGPVFWPFLIGDIFSFAFWPYDYYDPFWAFGPNFVLASIFAPGPYFGLDYGYGPDYYAYEGFPNIYYGSYGGSGYSGYGRGHQAAKSFKNRQVNREALAETNAKAVQSCGGLAPEVTDLPIDQIRQTVHPTAEQATALDDLSSALSKAKDIVEASCPKTVPLTPVGRLDAAEQRLVGTIQAVQIVRSPVEKFYDSLSDEQRQRFVAMGSSRRPEGEQSSAAAGGNLATMCSQQGEGFTNVPVQRIEQVVQPNAQQQGAFEELKKASENAAREFQASCPTQIPQTPTARFDAVKTRLSAMVNAMKTIRPKLEEFYASLSDEQKARFNTMGPPPQKASSQR